MEILQSIIKKDTKFHETNGWDNIFTLETITNVNNPKKNTIYINLNKSNNVIYHMKKYPMNK